MSLTINKKIVRKLSGPISMYLLFPTNEYSTIYSNAPIFILFGDKHNADEGFCKDGDLTSYKVFDPNFLQLLSDSIENKNIEFKQNRLIDFYLEGGEIHKFGITEYLQQSPMKQLWSLFTKCYNNRYETTQDLKEEDKANCIKMKNIRWQSGDIRFFKEEWDKFTFANMFQSIENDPFEGVGPPKDLRINMEEYTFKSRLKVEVSKAGKNIDNIKNFTCDAKHVYEEYVLNDKSLIFKQLNKIPNKDKEVIQEKFNEYINDFMSIYEKDDLKEYGVIANDFKSLLTTELNSKESEDSLDKIYDYYTNGMLAKFIKFIEMRRSVMLDLYTLARSYKRMLLDTYPKPIINICYFGDIHIVNIYNFLIKQRSTQGRTDSDYTLVMNAGKHEDGLRCLEMIGLPNIDNLMTMRMKPKKVKP
jgi:hypothetical protein